MATTSDAIKEEKADPPFKVIKNELEGMIALFQEIVSKWDSLEASSHQSSEASKKNDEANPPSQQSSEANRKNDEVNSRCSKKKEALFKAIVSKWDSLLALRSRWIKKKLENLKALFEFRVSMEDNLQGLVSALKREVDNLVSRPYGNDEDKLNRIIGYIQHIRNLVTPGMAPDLESHIRMISEAIQKKDSEEEEASHPEERSSFQRIKKELEKMIALFDGEDNLLSQVSALVGDVDNLVSGPYDNDGDKLNRIIDDIQLIRNSVSPPDLEYRILMISEVIQQEGSNFQKIKKELEKMIALFDGKVSKWEEHLRGEVSALERDIDNLVSGPDDNKGNINRIIGDIKRLRKLVTPVRPINVDLERERNQPEEEPSAKEVSQKWQQLHVEDQFFESSNMKNLKASFDNLENFQLKLCLLFLSIFPENSVIKKRPLINWWIGEGLIKAEGDKTAEEVGEKIFVKLIEESLIIAKFDNKWNWSPIVNRCEVHPWIRHMLISLVKEAQLFVFDSTGTPSCDTSCRRACVDSKSYANMSDQEAAKLLTVFNVGERYPSFKDANWLRKLKNVVALQLGRWQDSVEHHIEMENNILKDLGDQKHLKYLSLRGISRITALPDSIVNLINLEILDLRACHNLERLPDKIASLKKLTHLDVSECYLLESMPTGLEKLIALQVLKGFVVGDPNETSCRIGSLGKLKKLRRLGIRIGKTAEIRKEQFGKLGEIESLRCLTISWGKGLDNKDDDKDFCSLSFPSYLEKLDLRGIPVKIAPGWLHSSQLKNLKKLYIRGGELSSLDCKNTNNEETGSWQVETLILKYLKRLEIELSKLKGNFPRLRYLEKIDCHENDEDIVWDKSKGLLWTKKGEKRHATWESGASSSKS